MFLDIYTMYLISAVIVLPCILISVVASSRRVPIGRAATRPVCFWKRTGYMASPYRRGKGI